MKFLFDYFPIICFFIAYKIAGLYAATATAMACAFVQVAWDWFRYKKIEKLHIITFILIVIAGGLTLALHKPIFIKWKPTVVYWLFAALLFGSHFGAQPLLYRLLNGKITLPIKVWAKLNMAWAIFFLCMGVLNIYVLYHYSTNAWVDFKLFGTLGLVLVMVIVQALYITKHLNTSTCKKSLP